MVLYGHHLGSFPPPQPPPPPHTSKRLSTAPRIAPSSQGSQPATAGKRRGRLGTARLASAGDQDSPPPGTRGSGKVLGQRQVSPRERERRRGEQNPRGGVRPPRGSLLARTLPTRHNLKRASPPPLFNLPRDQGNAGPGG